MKIFELGHIVLYVIDIARSVKFYEETLGFKKLFHEGGAAVFSAGRTHHEMLLLEIGGTPRQKSRPEPGLYHIGFKIGDGPEAAKKAFAELKEAGVPIVGTSDHGVTHSIYILDPDGNELELYADVNDAWKTDPNFMMRYGTRHLPL